MKNYLYTYQVLISNPAYIYLFTQRTLTSERSASLGLKMTRNNKRVFLQKPLFRYSNYLGNCENLIFVMSSMLSVIHFQSTFDLHIRTYNINSCFVISVILFIMVLKKNKEFVIVQRKENLMEFCLKMKRFFFSTISFVQVLVAGLQQTWQRSSAMHQPSQRRRRRKHLKIARIRPSINQFFRPLFCNAFTTKVSGN